ncbi:DedA family protein [Candidatus Magnetominusculus xianensis]|uniref:Inner membrane protein YqjA n=1 Tax=Candidatus Magnetominusculus xianensis TaxID=1748249 RepID=A0ABR5SFB3_9BACT|nr:DedA family protein [Candidatus Magnetominusculus xianensis]KWT83490.1 inner membrane protein YqjA [Candidatus Magnetominusculus xianensis]
MIDLLKQFIEIVMHLDKHLGDIANSYGMWTYALLSVIVFCETGLVVTPFLPGDSLLFAAGTIAAISTLKLHWLIISLSLAAIIGDAVNYWAGYYIGPKVFHYENSRLLNKEYLERTRKFYEKYGAKAIIIARFVPIIRTFAPFVAGIGKMNYKRFTTYNIIGGICWVGICSTAGYFFGNIPIVKRNFTLVIFAIIIISILPAVVEFLRHKYEKK